VRRYANFWLLVLVLAWVLALGSSCAGSTTSEEGSAEQGGSEEPSNDMRGIDHSGMDMNSGQTMNASEMLIEDGEYSDERFIDAMVPHHQGAINMAQVAYQETGDSEIKDLALGIVTAQQQEIEQMIDWRKEWYPGG
jgi:uncharacterized protein (DUF305 family)